MAEPCMDFRPNPWRHNLCGNCAKKKDEHVAVTNPNEAEVLEEQPVASIPTVDTTDDDGPGQATEEVLPSLPVVLPPCRYGIDCYRTNSDHYQSFSHPEGHNRSSAPKRRRKKKLNQQKEKELHFITLMEERVNELITHLDMKSQEVDRLRKYLPNMVQYQKTLEQSLAEAYDDREKREIERQRVLAIPRRTPSYWGPNALTEYYREIKITEQSPEFGIITDLMNDTIVRHGDKYGTVYGHDPTEFIVTQIKRIQSTNLWHEYCYKKDSIIGKNRHKLPNCDSSKYLNVRRVLTPLLDDQANEYWLFHGCSHHTVSQLVLAGYDPRVSSLKGMFGGGFYLAENSSKSNQYIPCRHCGENAIPGQVGCTCRDQEKFVFTMVLYRAVLGDVHVAVNYDATKYRASIDNRGKRSYVRRPPLKPSGMDLYDSVMGESKQNGGDRLEHREFILYEKGQAYPEYIIDFRRSTENVRPPANIGRLQEKCRNFLRNTFRTVPE